MSVTLTRPQILNLVQMGTTGDAFGRIVYYVMTGPTAFRNLLGLGRVCRLVSDYIFYSDSAYVKQRVFFERLIELARVNGGQRNLLAADDLDLYGIDYFEAKRMYDLVLARECSFLDLSKVAQCGLVLAKQNIAIEALSYGRYCGDNEHYLIWLNYMQEALWGDKDSISKTPLPMNILLMICGRISQAEKGTALEQKLVHFLRERFADELRMLKQDFIM